MAINALAAIKGWLEAGLSEAGVAARVYVTSLPGGRNLFPCVLARRVPGTASGLYDPEQRTLIDVRCYGTTTLEAEAVYQAVRRLHGRNGMEVTGYRIELARETLSGSDLPDEVGDAERWECVFSTWELWISEI